MAYDDVDDDDKRIKVQVFRNVSYIRSAQFLDMERAKRCGWQSGDEISHI